MMTRPSALMPAVLLAMIVCLMTMPSHAQARDLYADARIGNDSAPLNCTVREQPCATIKFTVSVAQDGDTIHLTGGTFLVDTHTFVVPELEFVGDDAEPTVIDGQGQARNIFYTVSKESTFRHLHFRNATGTTLVYDFEGFAGPHNILDCIISDTQFGVGAVGAAIRVDATLFENVRQGALHLARCVADLSSLTFIANNFPFTNVPCGVAILSAVSNVTAQYLEFYNHANLPAGCVVWHHNGGTLAAQGISMHDNAAFLFELQDVNESAVVLDSLALVNNKLPAPTADQSALVALRNVAVTISSSSFAEQSAPALFAFSSDASAGPGVQLTWVNDNLSFSNNSLTDMVQCVSGTNTITTDATGTSLFDSSTTVCDTGCSLTLASNSTHVVRSSSSEVASLRSLIRNNRQFDAATDTTLCA